MTNNKVKKLKELSELYKCGVLTKEELETEKRKILKVSTESTVERVLETPDKKGEETKHPTASIKPIIKKRDFSSWMPKKKKKTFVLAGLILCIIGGVTLIIILSNRRGGYSDNTEDLIALDSMPQDNSFKTIPSTIPTPDGIAKFVEGFPTNYSIRNLGKDWIKSDFVRGSDQPLYGNGKLGHKAVKMVCVLSKDGYLYGRYYNIDGIELDVNGYLSQNGDIHIQLGHGSDASTLVVSPIAKVSPSETDYLYKGGWGKAQQPIELVFTPEVFSPTKYSFKDSKEIQWLYDAEMAENYDTDGTIFKSLHLRLPYTQDGNLLEFVESALIGILKKQYNFNADNLTSFTEAFLSTDWQGRILPRYSGTLPEFSNAEEGLSVKPLLSSDKFIQMEISHNFSGTIFMSSYSTYLFIIPLNYKLIPEGILSGKDLIGQGHEKDVLRLLNKYRPNPEYTYIDNIPDNIRVSKDSVIFRFPVEELGPRAAGEVEISIPLEEMKGILQPRVYNMIKSSINWKEY